jgi:hypothetical protein
MPFCSECGAEVPAGVNFCGKCGNPLTGGRNPATYRQTNSAGIKPAPTVGDFDDMEKKPSNYTIVIIAVMAVCVAAIIGTIVMKLGAGADGKTSSAAASNTDFAQSAIIQVEYQGTMVKGSKQLSIKFIVDWLPNGEIHKAYSIYTKYNVPIDLVIERGGPHCNYATPCFIENYNTDNEAAFVFNNLTANSTTITGKWISRNDKDNVYDVRLEKSNTGSAQGDIPVTSVKVGGDIADLVPSGYQVFKELKGDLNKDGLDDYVLMIVNKQNVVRCGIVIVFNNGGNYEVVLENRNSFSYNTDEGENIETDISDGALNIKPEDGYGASISIEAVIKKGILNIKHDIEYCGAYCGGGEGYSYNFRYQNSDFEMIGYDGSSFGRGCNICDWESFNTSINLMTKKMQTKKTVTTWFEVEETQTKVFDEEWYEITIKEPLKLRNIKFGEFNIMDYISKK